MTAVGVAGLGAMGSRIAGRLLDGNPVYGTNRTRPKASPLTARGMIWRDTPRQVADKAQVIISMITDDAALEAVTSGPDGILAGLAPGKIYVDMSTVSPQMSRNLASRVSERGSVMLDAPVSGSVTAAQNGTLAIMAGGPEDAFHQVEPLLRRLGTTVTHVGANGHGLLLKLAINISLTAQMLAFSEGVLLAARGGIDPAQAAEAMASSPIGSPMLQARVPLLLDLPGPAWFTMRLMHKDIRLALQTAAGLGVPAPSAQAAARMLATAGELGYADRDIAAFNQVLTRAATAPGGPAAPDQPAVPGAGKNGTAP
jgi:3-hydroxyisobutyrate dehydrogenase-like beta-hydroxyacid dehydrogenase